MNNKMEIHSRQQFRLWLAEHFLDRNGVWVIFSKGNVSNTLRASEALEEALCFGWIDGQIRPIDEVKYMKYFAPRGEKSTWSERNKKLAEKLVGAGLFTEYGVSVMERSKNNGSWDHKEKSINLDSMVNTLAEKLKKSSVAAYEKYSSISESRKRQLARFFEDAKSEEVREKRVRKIVEALMEQKKGMLY